MRITSTPIPAYLCLILGCSSGPAEIEYGPPISEAQTFSLDGGRITVTALPGTRLPVDGISLAELSVDEVPSLIRDAASASLPIVVAVNLGPDGAEFSPPLLLSALIDTPTDARGFAVAALTTDGGRPESLPASAEPVDEDTLRADVDVAHFSVVAVQMGPSAEPGADPYADRAARLEQARRLSLDGARILPPNRNYVFTSSELLDGTLTTTLDGQTFSGVAEMDDLCRFLATRHLEETGHQIPGSDFVALINGGPDAQRDTLGPDRRPVLEDLRGALYVPPSAQDFDEIEAGRRSFAEQEIQFRDRTPLAGRLSGPASRDLASDELGGTHAEPLAVWTGARAADAEQDWAAAGADCSVGMTPWATTDAEGSVGSPFDPDTWNEVGTQPCARRNAIYCVAVRDEQQIPPGINFLLPPSAAPGPFELPDPEEDPPLDVPGPEDLLHCRPGGRPVPPGRVPGDMIAASTATLLEDGTLEVPVSFSGFSEGGERPSSGSLPVCDTPSQNYVVSGVAFIDPPLFPPNNVEFLGQIFAPVLFDLDPPTANCSVVPVPGSGRLGSGGSARGPNSNGVIILAVDPGGLTGTIRMAGPSDTNVLALEVTVTQDGSGAGDQVDRFTCGTPPPADPVPMGCVPGEILREETRTEPLEFVRIGVDDLYISNLGGTRLISVEEGQKLIAGLRSSFSTAFSVGGYSGKVTTGLQSLVDVPIRGSQAKRVLLDQLTSIVITDPKSAYAGFQGAAADAILAELSRLLPLIQGGWIDADITFGRFWERRVTLDVETQLSYVCNPDGTEPRQPVEGDVTVRNADIGPCVYTSTEGGTVNVELDVPVPMSNNVARATAEASRQALSIAPRRFRVLAGREIGACM